MELSPFLLAHADLLQIADCVWVLVAPTDNSNYDFSFDRFFPYQRGLQLPHGVQVFARTGAIPNYGLVFETLQYDEQITLVNNPAEYQLATNLPSWYPLISDLTPRSIWFSGRPDPELVGSQLGWPVFMKGARQTSRHQKSLSIIDGPDSFAAALAIYAQDPILRNQQIVCREFFRLRLVDDSHPTRLPSAVEYRTFWWRGSLVGWGRYWWDSKKYDVTESEKVAALALAKEAASRVRVPFLVVDVAQTQDGRWIVIECNDGQESGYGGVSPIALWQKIIDVERAKGE